ncbi:MAG: flagellar protein FlbB [Treponema sp.]|nr:flagellar protein FlbB [Treponema sp.]MCL2251262.1 flagellar protein FlbB [Treponema sp.]
MIGRSILLLLLIVVLAAGSIIWFDYLNVIDAKTVLAPLYRLIPFIPGEGRTQERVSSDEILNLDAERLSIRLEALELRNMELDTRQRELDNRYGEIEQMAQELEERQNALDDRENSLRVQSLDAENKNRNIEQNARHLTNMPPQNAVNIIAALDDQDAIDVLRKTEEIAQAEGTTSIVPFWLSLMDPARAAELQRKMAGRPSSL